VADVALLYFLVADPISVGDRQHPAVGSRTLDDVLLAEGTQVQMVLVQPSQQLSAVGLQVVLELVVDPPAGLAACEGDDKGIEGDAGGAEGVWAVELGGV
jgi:hypothetical protein